ncbi:MAG: AtpZ/AtpI family protein [Candidatus Nomurabacteria bacterium]|nr:MAG: AtpZ/AtpI family protein [Candidatus Nomurabacteria bacterium]
MNEENIQDLKKRRDKITNKIFLLGLKIALIFGIPAVLGAIIGRELDEYLGTSPWMKIIVLFIAFVSSWFMVYMEYKRLSRELEKVESEISNSK